MQNTFDSKLFRKVLGSFSTGITVVTTPDGSTVHGMTANAFTSVSLEPPLVLISIDKRTNTHGMIQESKRFGINILEDSQEAYSRHFSGKPDSEVMMELQYKWVKDIPVLSRCLASLACTLWASYDGGDHTLYVGEVQTLDLHGGDPLIFFNSAYYKLQKSS